MMKAFSHFRHRSVSALRRTARGISLIVAVFLFLTTAAAAPVTSMIKLVEARGSSIAISGDTLLATDKVYVRSGNSWFLQQMLAPADPDSAFGFVIAAAVHNNTAIIGAPLRGDQGINAGAAYVFARIGNAWVQQAKLLASDGQPNAGFGASVGFDGDTIVVGAPGEDGAVDGSGAAYVFVRAGAEWTQQAKLIAVDGLESDSSGRAVAISGDTVALGGNVDNGNADAFVYLFERNGAAWTQQTKLQPSSGDTGTYFGEAVALDGDTLVVGASRDDFGGIDSGLAYVYVRSGGAWAEQAKLIPAAVDADDEFGASVAVDGDVAVIGAPGAEPEAAYVFSRSGGSWSQHAGVTPGGSSVTDDLGSAVAVSGGVAAIGAPGENFGGSVYVAILGNFGVPAVAGNVVVTKMVDDAQPGASPFQFNVQARNTDQQPVSDVTVVDQLPPDFQIPVGMAPFTSVGDYDLQTGVWTIGDLPAAGNATLTIPAVIAPSARGPCAVNYAALSGIADPNPADDNASVALVVRRRSL